MAIQVISGFDVSAAVPADTKNVIALSSSISSISASWRYDGLKVYAQDTDDEWQLIGGVANSNWTRVTDNGVSVSASYAYTASVALNVIGSSLSSSWASQSLSSSTVFNDNISIDHTGTINSYGELYIGQPTTHSGVTFKSGSSATSYGTNELELSDTYLTFMPKAETPFVGTERRIYADENGTWIFDSLDGYPVSFINAISHSFDTNIVAPNFIGTSSWAISSSWAPNEITSGGSYNISASWSSATNTFPSCPNLIVTSTPNFQWVIR